MGHLSTMLTVAVGTVVASALHALDGAGGDPLQVHVRRRKRLHLRLLVRGVVHQQPLHRLYLRQPAALSAYTTVYCSQAGNVQHSTALNHQHPCSRMMCSDDYDLDLTGGMRNQSSRLPAECTTQAHLSLGGLLIGADDLQCSALQAVDIPLALAVPGVGVGLHELDVLALPLVVRQAVISCGGCAVPSLLLLVGNVTFLLRLVMCRRLSCILRMHGIDSGVQVQSQSGCWRADQYHSSCSTVGVHHSVPHLLRRSCTI